MFFLYIRRLGREQNQNDCAYKGHRMFTNFFLKLFGTERYSDCVRRIIKKQKQTQKWEIEAVKKFTLENICFGQLWVKTVELTAAIYKSFKRVGRRLFLLKK